MAYEEPVDVESRINALTNIVEQLSLTIKKFWIIESVQDQHPKQ